MASRRLNNSLRNQIVEKLIERTFPQRYKALSKDLGVWMAQYHQLWHAGYEAVLDQLPDRAAISAMTMSIRCGSRQHHTEAVQVSSDYPLKSFHDFPHGYEYQSDIESRLIKAAGKTKKVEACIATLQELLKRHKAIGEERAKVRSDAIALLQSVQTYKALLEVWPEIAEVVGTEEAPKPQRALVKNLGALNEAFNLVKERKVLPKPLVAKKKAK